LTGARKLVMKSREICTGELLFGWVMSMTRALIARTS